MRGITTVYKCANLVKAQFMFVYPSCNSFKYIPLDAARLNKYGLWGVFLESLDKKVRFFSFSND